MTATEQKLILRFQELGTHELSSTLLSLIQNPRHQKSQMAELMLIAVESELSSRREQKAQRLLSAAKLKDTIAHIDRIEYLPERNIDKLLVQRMASGKYLEDKCNICITGASGTGKTFLGKALLVEACMQGYRSKVTSYPRLLRELSYLRKQDVMKYEKKLSYYSKFPVLLIDEWLCEPPYKGSANILLELMELRYGNTSTILCSQLHDEHWPTMIGNKALGQSITGRITASSFTFKLEGEDMRKKYPEKP